MAKRKKELDESLEENQEEIDNSEMDNEDIIRSICKKISEAEILDEDEISRLGFISTGVPALDFICSGKFYGGGFPMGRTSEIFGPSSAGKTLVGSHMLLGAQRMNGISVLIDSEHAYSTSFSKDLGINTKQLVYMDPTTLEKCFDRIVDVTKLIRSKSSDMRPIGLVYDSIAASPSNSEQEAIEKGEPFKAEMGERARICSRYLRNISSIIAKEKIAVLVVNQIRSKLNVMFGNNETTAGGGNSLEYYCSVRLDCRGTKAIIDDKKRIIGRGLKIKCVKNKVAKPFRVIEDLKIYFDKGIAPLSGLDQILEEEGRITKTKSWYTVTGTDYNFQKKDMLQALLDYPALIDAPNAEEVKKYLGITENNQIVPTELENATEIEEEEN